MKKLIGKGRLPLKKNLNKLNSEQLRNVLSRFGINAEEIRNQLLREMSKPAAELSRLKRLGITPDQAKLNQLYGQIKRIRSGLERRMTNKAIEDFKQAKTEETEKDNLKKRIWVWICKFKNSCDSCIPRHNQIKTWNQWKRLGMPKSDALICSSNCNCNLEMRLDIEGVKIEKNPDNLDDLRTTKRTNKEVKQIKNELKK